MTHSATNSSEMLMLLLVIALGAIYLLPAIIGGVRGVRFALLLYLTSLLVGWTVLGWLGCLAWALKAQSGRPLPRVVLVRDGQNNWHVARTAVAHGHHH
jgi:hypothetical protein